MKGSKTREKTYHVPAMVKEVLREMVVDQTGIYIDATLGGGGHAEAILRTTSPLGRVIGIDCDNDAIVAASKRLRYFKERVSLVKSNFANLSRVLDVRTVKEADGILADLGVSTHHLNIPERGFSFQKRGPIDMRMDRELTTSAAELINTASEIELADWFYRYGEERFARRISRHICKVRRQKNISDTLELAKLVLEAIPSHARRSGKIHPATRVFQALRIVVNAELRNLEMFLGIAPRYLKSKGRLVIISYHSLEDRIVKERFKALSESGFQIITKKPMVPALAEIRKNPSARSAKLRILEKL